MNRALLVGIVLVAVVAVALALYLGRPSQTAVGQTTTAAGQTAAGQAAACPSLTVLTRHPSSIQNATLKLFLSSETARRYGIRELSFRSIPAAQWAEVIRRGEADVAWGGGPTLFDSLYQQGLLLPLEGEEVRAAIGQIPRTVAGASMVRVGPDGKPYWVATFLSSFGITLNRDFLRRFGLPEPTTWADLASLDYSRPILQGVPATGIGDISRSTSSLRMAEIILQAYGWERGWQVIALTAANGKVYDGSEGPRDALIRGEIGAGWTIDFYGYTAQLQNPANRYVIPPETSVNGDPIAVVANARCRQAAEAFVAWVLTEGQAISFDPAVNRMPVNPKAFDTPQGRARQDLKAVYDAMVSLKAAPFNDTLALSIENAAMYYFVAAIKDNLDLLQQAWTRLARAYREGRLDRATAESLAARLTAPVTYVDPETGQRVRFTLEQAQAINRKLTDPTYRDRVMAAWRAAARQQYQEVLQQIP